MPAPRTFLVMSLVALPVLALTGRSDVPADSPEARADRTDARPRAGEALTGAADPGSHPVDALAQPADPRSHPVDAFAHPTDPQTHPLDALAWMAGCWAATRPDRSYEEHWMAPRGGVMLGMSRSVSDGRATGHEFLRIAGGDEGLVYHAAPSGQAPTDFVATAVGGDTAVFENPAHDFPTRIAYRRGTADSLWARAEAPGPDGRMSGVEFRMGRVACP